MEQKALAFIKAFKQGSQHVDSFSVNFFKSMELQRVIMDDKHPGTLVFTMKMPDFTRNAFNVAHGGALTTYVDIATTAAAYTFDRKSRAQVSAGLDLQFYLPATIG